VELISTLKLMIMDNWKSLMVTPRHWECNAAENLLKLNGIKTQKMTILMNKPDNPHEIYGCAKLTVCPAEYERGLNILHKNGFKSDQEFSDVNLIEINTQQVNPNTIYF
jgi:hypothetical protein